MSVDEGNLQVIDKSDTGKLSNEYLSTVHTHKERLWCLYFTLTIAKTASGSKR